VCDVLFSRAPSDPAIQVEDLGALATYIRDNSPPITDAAVLSNLRVFSNTMAARETAWLVDIQKLLDYVEQTAQSKDDRRAVREALNSKGFEELWAILAVAHYADLSGLSPRRRRLSVPTQASRLISIASDLASNSTEAWRREHNGERPK
jgi:hypothetical protein